MLPPPGLLPRLVAHDAAYTAQRQSCIAAQPGNPFGAHSRQNGTAHGFITKGVPTPWLNRVLGANAAQVPAFAAWFRAAGLAPRFETIPGLHDAATAHALAAAGCAHTADDTITWSRPAPATPGLPVETVTHDVLDAFLDAHLEAWSMPAAHHAGAKRNMSGWLGLPGWILLALRIDRAIAATGVLHLHDGLAYIADTATRPAFRKRGAQSALLRACLNRASREGAALAWSRCAFLSGSHRNMARAGLATLCTPAHWTA